MHEHSSSDILQIVAAHAGREPRAIALLSDEGAELTYEGLQRHLLASTHRLQSLGFRNPDRLALLSPNGPEMATAFLAISSLSACAPLNPGYRDSELEFYLTDARVSAIVIAHGLSTAAGEVARRLGITVIELLPTPENGPGTFVLEEVFRDAKNHDPATVEAQDNDTGLLLHTSGTTSRPKLVPLTRRNLFGSARNIQRSLQLTAADRCLNVMPLFHIHGLAAGLLASLVAGGSVICTRGFDVQRFYGTLASWYPTWYTAVPTMHQSILAAAADHRDIIRSTGLRFIRSSSSALPPQVMLGLEAAFGVPVLESYGMTEAAHQMCSNPLPPAVRKPGSVGLPAGPEVAIMNEAGNLLPAGEIGEIVIRGENVTCGYENNSAANQAAFTAGWFRTGDQGRCDEEGYHYLTGRLKEIINRGGEKISPREVDEVLLDHPSVAQAITFGRPHARLGEDLLAAVVLKPGMEVSEGELRTFTLSRLAPEKTPSRIVIVSEIPKGPTGKLQRIGLHEKLHSYLHVDFSPPQTPCELIAAAIWREVLNIDQVGTRDNFFLLGGDSLLAMQVMVRVQEKMGISPSIADLFRDPVLEAFARVLADLSAQQEHAAPAADMQALLDRIAGLSDEEAERLLREELDK